MDDLLAEFLTETAESLEVIDVELVRFEANPSDEATLNNIFRLVHTIKGTCGFLGLPRLEGVAHASETLLGRYRDRTLTVTPQAVTTVLGAIDRIKTILNGLRETGQEPPGDDSPLINALQALSAGESVAAAPPAPPAGPPPVDENGNKWDADLQRYLRPGEVSLAELEAAFKETAIDLGPSAAKAAAPTPPAPPMAAAAPPPFEPDHEDPRAADAASQTIRVNVEVLEALMTTVSELVLTRNQLLQMVRNQSNSEFKTPLQRLSNITVELQDRVMKTRMQPVGAAWRKLPRIVRNASNDLGKKIELRLEGEATELDRQVLEMIKDPLTHMVRNSCDHGLEKPEVRKAAGKPEAGTIVLSAYYEGGAIIIELADDGAGLNTERIREKAIQKGLVSAAEAASLSDAQVHRYIFAPGFSTAEQVTNLSGRGVGMDVVKTNIEQIGGSIELSSERGKGSRFKIKIPLTLAIVSALVLGVRGQRFAAPQSSVVELVQVGGESEHLIEQINEAPVLRLREALLPLVDLADILSLPRALGAPGADRHDAARFVAVMQVAGDRFGLIVDQVHDTEEIVVKPLASLLRGIRAYSGATILGDGAVVMILDPNGLADAIGGHREREETQEAAALLTTDSEETRLIVFRASESDLKAAPLELVTRLEEIEVERLERADGRVVVQFRGELMPVSHIAGEYAYKQSGRQPVLVFNHEGRNFGLAVDQIVDIVEERVNLDLAADRPGVVGAAVIKGSATEIIDVGHYLHQMQGDWRPARRGLPKASILLVDPSAFSRGLMTPLLQAAGYGVTHAASPEDARAMLANGVRFDVVLADMDADPEAAAAFGEELASNPAWAAARPLAISRESGAPIQPFLERLAKTDRGGLLSALEYALRSKELAA